MPLSSIGKLMYLVIRDRFGLFRTLWAGIINNLNLKIVFNIKYNLVYLPDYIVCRIYLLSLLLPSLYILPVDTGIQFKPQKKYPKQNNPSPVECMA